MRRILLAYTVNELGTWFGYVALAVGVYDATGSVVATAALFIARGLLPALLAPMLVVRVERSAGRGRLAALYVVEGVLTLGLAALIWRFWLPGVLILVALDGIAAVAATALVRATAARIAEERPGSLEAAQRRANASLNVAFMASFAVGPAIGGVVVHLAGGPVALLVDAASFMACGLLLVGLRTADGAAGEGGSVRSRLAGAWQHIREMPALRVLLVTEAVAVTVFASVEPVEVVYAKSTLAAGDAGLGLLLGLWGLGAAIGSIVFARSVTRALGPILTVGTLLVGIGYVGFAAAPTLALACPAALVGGVGNGIQWPALVSAVQRLTPSALQGRLMGAIGSMGAICPAIGFALGGTFAALTSTRVALWTAGGIIVLATIAFMRLPAGSALDSGDQAATAPVEVMTR